jgi:hypothetical protein
MKASGNDASSAVEDRNARTAPQFSRRHHRAVGDQVRAAAAGQSRLLTAAISGGPARTRGRRGGTTRAPSPHACIQQDVTKPHAADGERCAKAGQGGAQRRCSCSRGASQPQHADSRTPRAFDPTAALTIDSDGVMLPLGVLLPVMLALAVRLAEDETVPLGVCRGGGEARADRRVARGTRQSPQHRRQARATPSTALPSTNGSREHSPTCNRDAGRGQEAS